MKKARRHSANLARSRHEARLLRSKQAPRWRAGVLVVAADLAPLTGYWGVSGVDFHGHYIPPYENQAVTHQHKNGKQAHAHEIRNGT